MSQSRPNILPPGTVVHERYRVVAPVGHGGLGTVYQVTDILFGRENTYALKEQWDQSESARKQFAREGAWLQALNHHHIPKVTEYFEWQGRLYLVMDFVDGENLEQKLANAGGRPLAEGQVLAWVIPICDALHYMHTRLPPLIHRDVKPSNIIVTPAGHPVLVDLGIAKEHAPGTNATATFVRKAGTEGYAPPEQYAAAGQAGPWSDVYGMGATLYHLLTTQIPPTAVERVALDIPLRHPRELNPTVTSGTDAAILRALAIRPQDRFKSMLEFRSALEAAAAPQATHGLPPAPYSPLPYAMSHPGQPPRSPVPDANLATPAQVVSVKAAARGAAATGAPNTGRPVTGGLITSRSLARPPRSNLSNLSHPSHPSRPDALQVAGELAAATPPRSRRASVFAHPLAWGAGLIVAILIGTFAAVSITRMFGPLDRSTPTATVAGYFDALVAQDYSRAWQYTTASSKNQTSEAEFAKSLATDDARLGRVLSYTIGPFQQANSGQVTGIVRAVRVSAPGTPVIYSVLVTQYGDIWLIDAISSS